MKMLRRGGEFLDRHIRHSGKTAVWSFVGFAAACALFFFVSYKLVALAGLLLAFWQFTLAYDKWEHWFFGKRGELAVIRELSELPDGYVLLNDLMLPRARGNIDHFLIGPNGLFVIETKNYSANVRCDGDRWFLNGKPVRSLGSRARGNAVALRESLKALFAEHRAPLPYIEPIVAFAKHRHRLDLNEPTVHVLRAEELVDFIADYRPRSRSACLSPALIRATVRHLQYLQNAPASRPERAAPGSVELIESVNR